MLKLNEEQQKELWKLVDPLCNEYVDKIISIFSKYDILIDDIITISDKTKLILLIIIFSNKYESILKEYIENTNIKEEKENKN